MPFAQRKKLLERTRSRKKKTKESTASSNSEIVAGSTVSTSWMIKCAGQQLCNSPQHSSPEDNTPHYNSATPFKTKMRHSSVQYLSAQPPEQSPSLYQHCNSLLVRSVCLVLREKKSVYFSSILHRLFVVILILKNSEQNLTKHNDPSVDGSIHVEMDIIIIVTVLHTPSSPWLKPLLLLQVCLRSTPLYHAGAMAFAYINGVPKVGYLVDSAWLLSDSCRFRIKAPNR